LSNVAAHNDTKLAVITPQPNAKQQLRDKCQA
jgi:hypothetical protein